MSVHDQMMKAPTVAAAFEMYREHVISPKAGPNQIEESRRVFMAASYWVIKRMINGSVADELKVARLLDSFVSECVEFAQEVDAGKRGS